MPAAAQPPTVRFVVVGVAHPHAIVLTAGLLEGGAECIGWVDTPGDHDGLFARLFPDLPLLDIDGAFGSEPDLVVIAGVPNTRAGYAIDAMEAGADVLVAKPAVTNSAHVDALREAVRRTGRRWWVAFTEHFTSRAVIRADSIIASGRIGTVRHVIGVGPHRRGGDRPYWFSDPEQAGSMLADLASHQIHHIARLLGTDDLTIVAARMTPAPGSTHPELLAELMLEGGTGSAYIKVDWLSPDGLDTWGDVRLMITGDSGTIEVRANCDPGGHPGPDHLIVVDSVGVERLECSNDELTWAATLIADVGAGTERLVTTAHCLAVSTIALQASARATI